MMKGMIFPLCCLVVMGGGCKSSKPAQGGESSPSVGWQRTPLVIDGLDDDWIKPLPYSNDGEKIHYGITNDGDNLYIMLSTRDPQEQAKIMQGGMTVWINNQAEKDFNTAVGINFPTDVRNDHDRQLMAEARPDKFGNQTRRPDDLKDYALYNFNKDEPIQNIPLGQMSNDSVEVKLNFNTAGELIYEAKVPLNAVFFPGRAIRRDARFWGGRNLAVGFYFEGLPPRPGGDPGGGGGGGGVSIGGGLGMGSFGSGGGIGIGIGTGSLGRIGGGKGKGAYKPSKVWQVVTLSRAH